MSRSMSFKPVLGELVLQNSGHCVLGIIEPMVLVIHLLGLFLGDVRAAVTVALVLPLAALC